MKQTQEGAALVLAGKIQKQPNGRVAWEVQVAAPAFRTVYQKTGVSLDAKAAAGAIVEYLRIGITRQGDGVEKRLDARTVRL